MDPVVSPVIKYLVTSGVLGITALVFIWFFFKERRINQEKDKAHSDNVKELTNIVLDVQKKSIEAITRNTEVLRALSDLNAKVLDTHIFDSPPSSHSQRIRMPFFPDED